MIKRLNKAVKMLPKQNICFYYIAFYTDNMTKMNNTV